MQSDTQWLEGLEEIRIRFVREGLSEGVVETFRTLVWDYYHEHERKFPWRETTDPYRILVSEIMLQQTQALRVVSKYEAFLEKFPTARQLADAPVSHLLEAWQGLGYNRRALALQRAVQQVVFERAGIFPTDTKELERLPGIGPYTAAAVSAFAFNQASVMLETNIRRLYIQAFFTEGQPVDDREIRPLIAATVEPEQPRDWYYALMDLGHDVARMLPNPNVRSRHYAKQSKFQGSHRQLRGKILKLLLAGQRPLDVLAEELGLGAPELRPTLNELEREGFVVLDEVAVGLLS